MAALSPPLPLLLTECLASLSDFVSSSFFTFGRSGERVRSMRADRRASLLNVLSVLVRACSIQHEGLFCHLDKGWARLMTVAEIASYAGICARTVFRCLEDLKDLGLIECQQIKRKNPTSGQIEVSIGIRRFTPLFWEKVHLKELFKRSCDWAKKHGKRRLLMPFKAIRQKAKTTFAAAKTVADSVLKSLDPESLRVKQHCEGILNMLRQRK